MGKEAEALMQTVLRSYTGIFTDYAYISETALSLRTGLTRSQIYNLLMMLSKRRIIDYIPRKKTPYIIYTRERVEPDRLHIPPSVYEERKKRYVARIEAMVEYVTSETACRSRMLLRYFGEKNEHNCGQCEEVKEKLLDLLKERPLTPAEVSKRMEEDKNILAQVIQYLLEEEIIKTEDGMLSKVIGL